MNNVYFGANGITSTEGNYLCNIAKELQQAATERLNNVKFFDTSVAVIGSSDKQVMSVGNKDLGFIELNLQELAEANAFCAWVREAIKEKEAQQYAIDSITINTWAVNNNIELPVIEEDSGNYHTFTEQDVINSWDINKRNKYLKLEAFAATYGKYVHPEGAYSKARKNAHSAWNNPITKEGTGRDMILYYKNPSVTIEQVDEMFFKLQDTYRAYEKELNQMKAEIKNSVNDLTRQANAEYQKQLDDYAAQRKEYNAKWAELRTQFNTWKTNELERISKYKIIIPDSLKSIFKTLQSIGNASK